MRLRSQPACGVDHQRQVAAVGVREKQMACGSADRSASAVTNFLDLGLGVVDTSAEPFSTTIDPEASVSGTTTDTTQTQRTQHRQP